MYYYWERAIQRHQNEPPTSPLPYGGQNREETRTFDFPLSMIKLCCKVVRSTTSKVVRLVV